MNNENTYRVSFAPHVRSRITTGDVMYDVILALIPAALFGAGYFGAHVLMLLVTGVCTAMITEFAINCLTGREDTLHDTSAALTGLLLAMCLPPDATVLMAFVGSAAAVVLKAAFGGLGKNRLNPALMGRCVLMIVFGTAMTAYLKQSGWTAEFAGGADIARSLIGSRSAVIGGSVIALALGGAWLLWTGQITWQTPVGIAGSYLILVLILDGASEAVFHTLFFLSGGGMLAACFMATDPVTSPVKGTGKLCFGVCIGLISALLRNVLGPAEAVCLAVLAADLFTPLIDRVTTERAFR